MLSSTTYHSSKNSDQKSATWKIENSIHSSDMSATSFADNCERESVLKKYFR